MHKLWESHLKTTRIIFNYSLGHRLVKSTLSQCKLLGVGESPDSEWAPTPTVEDGEGNSQQHLGPETFKSVRPSLDWKAATKKGRKEETFFLSFSSSFPLHLFGRGEKVQWVSLHVIVLHLSCCPLYMDPFSKVWWRVSVVGLSIWYRGLLVQPHPPVRWRQETQTRTFA